MKKSFITFILFLFSVMGFAQDFVLDDEIKIQCKQKVNKYVANIRDIVNKNLPQKQRQALVISIKSMFYGKCESVDIEGVQDIATMEVLSATRNTTRYISYEEFSAECI